MQKLNDQQKTELIEQGHSWQFDKEQEIPVVYYNSEKQFSCLCSEGLINYYEFWRMEHQENCVLSNRFNVTYTRLKED